MARSGELNGFLDVGSELAGELRFTDTFRVDGKVSGRIVSPGDLIIGEAGEVEADVEVGRLFVAGVLRGRASAERIELERGSRVEAELATPSLVVAEGAILRVRCEMEDSREAGPDGEAER
ncbi:MAG: bactofilin family protein [Thermoanaerobaculia bacterium]